MKLIELRNKKKEVIAYTMVDDEDFEYLNKFKWSLHTRGKKRLNSAPRVARSMPKGDTGIKFMHRFIWNMHYGLDNKQFIDHKDLNPLNNQKENLRLCTIGQNCANVGKRNKISTSIYKGVHFDKNTNKWNGTITLNNQRIHLGGFLNEKDAAIAYDIKARELFGEFARCNFQINEIDNQHIKNISDKINKIRAYSSKFVGVRKARDSWRASCYIKKDKEYIQINIGSFNNEQDAALARDYFVLNLNSDSKRIEINFPNATQEDYEKINNFYFLYNKLKFFKNKYY